MRVLRGIVVKGQVVVEGEGKPLTEGEHVTVVVDEPYSVTGEEALALEEADRDIEQGRGITVDELLEEMRRTRG